VSKALQYLTGAVVVLSFGVGIGLQLGRADGKQSTNNSPGDIAGATYRMERAYRVEVHVPNVEIEAVLKSVVAEVGLEYGKYDQVAFLDAAGLEQFRPMEGSKAGKRAEAGRVLTTNVSFSVPHDAGILKKALDAVRYVHSYEEPVIYVSEVWRSRATGGDGTNPNRWWNRKPQ